MIRKVSDHIRNWFTLRNGGRLKDYDELWPVRYSVRKIYGDLLEGKCELQTLPVRSIKQSDQNALYKVLSSRSTLEYTEAMSMSFRIQKSRLLKWTKLLFQLRFSVTPVLKFILTFFLTLIIYIFSILTCCAPCCFHYICSSRSFYHRHKCSGSFVRYVWHIIEHIELTCTQT